MRSPAFQFYPQDFLVGTAHMTTEEVGGYIRLLCYQWAKDALPKNDKILMQLSGITDPYVLGNVVVMFRLCEDNLLRNDRLVKIKLEQDEYHEKQRINGLKGGNPAFKKGQKNPYYKQHAKDNPLVDYGLSSGDNPKINPSPSPSPSPSSSINKEEGSPSDMPEGALRVMNQKPSGNRKRMVGPLEFEFRSTWNKEYLTKFGHAYVPKGEADDKGLDKLLSHVQDVKKLIDIAKKAWDLPDDFNCKMAVTISGFCSRFNEIRATVFKQKNHVSGGKCPPSSLDIMNSMTQPK